MSRIGKRLAGTSLLLPICEQMIRRLYQLETRYASYSEQSDKAIYIDDVNYTVTTAQIGCTNTSSSIAEIESQI